MILGAWLGRESLRQLDRSLFQADSRIKVVDTSKIYKYIYSTVYCIFLMRPFFWEHQVHQRLVVLFVYFVLHNLC